MATFIAWLKGQDGRRDQTGDLARAWESDKAHGNVSTPAGMKRHINAEWPEDGRAGWVAAVDQARSEYDESRQTGRVLTPAEQARWDEQVAADRASRPPLAAVPDPPPAEACETGTAPSRQGMIAGLGAQLADGDQYAYDEAAGQASPGEQAGEAAGTAFALTGDSSADLERIYEHVTGQQAPPLPATITEQTAEVITEVVVPALDQIRKRLDWQTALLEAMAPPQALESAARQFLAEQADEIAAAVAEDTELIAAAATADFGE